MFEIAFKTIPKGINELYWLGGIIGIVILLLTIRGKEKSIYLFFLLTLFLMIIWRIQYRIITSRYSLSLIYHFIIFSAYAISSISLKKKSLWKWALLITFIISMYFLGVSIKRNREDLYYYAVASLYKEMFFSNKNYKFYVMKKDFQRIRFMSGVKDCKELTEEKNGFVDEMCRKNNTAYYKLVVATTASQKQSFEDKPYATKPKTLLSFQTGKSKKTFHTVYLITSTVKCYPFSLTSKNNYSVPNNVLNNWNMEEIESEQDSFQSLSKNIRNYEKFYDANSRNRTPVGAYFHSTTPLTGDEIFTVTSENAIFGNSVKIRSPEGLTYLLFSNKLQNGDFTYSFYVKGDKGTIVRMICTPNRWKVNTLAEFEIPDKRTYCITCEFSVNDIQPPQYFIVGASVLNGEAFLDNFILLNQANPKTLTISE